MNHPDIIHRVNPGRATVDLFSTDDQYTIQDKLRFWKLCKQYRGSISALPAGMGTNVYAVADFYMDSANPKYYSACFQKFDQRMAKALACRNYYKKKESRPNWVAIPERATNIHLQPPDNRPAPPTRTVPRPKFQNLERNCARRQILPGASQSNGL